MILSLLLICSYILYIIIKYGVPHSLSQTYYLLKHKWIFSLVLITSTAIILPEMLEMNYSYLAFPTLCGVLFVAVTPNFRDDNLVDQVHTWSAVVALIFSQLWVGLTNPIILNWWILFLIYLYIQYKKYRSFKKILDESNSKFYAELIMLLTVYSILFIQ